MQRTVCVCEKVHMFATDGGLRHMDNRLVPELQKQGWIVVTNPKRSYAPEYDQTSPYYRPDGKHAELELLHVDII